MFFQVGAVLLGSLVGAGPAHNNCQKGQKGQKPWPASLTGRAPLPVEGCWPPERLARFPPFPGWIAARLEPVGAELHKMVSAWSSRSRAKRRLVPKKYNVAEDRARAVCIELARATGNRPMQYRMVRPIVMAAGLDDAAADAAIAYAVDKGWLVTDIAEEGPPHSICLTDAGRRLVAGR